MVVVDNGTDQPAVFFTSIPANLVESNVQTLVSSLALSTSGTTAPTDAGAATDSAPATAGRVTGLTGRQLARHLAGPASRRWPATAARIAA